MENKKERLQTIYDDFETAAAPYKTEAACGKGCAFCCSEAGSIHITTLEGVAIRDRINRLPRSRQVAVNRKLAADMKQRERNKLIRCAMAMIKMAEYLPSSFSGSLFDIGHSLYLSEEVSAKSPGFLTGLGI